MFLGNLFRNERPVNREMKDMIVSTLEKLHISCGCNCLETAKSKDDFIGICVLHKDGNKLLEDNARRVKSGYIFVARPSDLTTPGDTRHRQTYNMLFKDIENFDGVVIVGFSQQDKKLKGTSGTFNTNYATTLMPDRPKESLFIFRTLIFGAIIMYKLSGSRNVSAYSACLCICLFLIVKNGGDKEDLDKFPVSDLDLENRNIFAKEMFVSLGVESRILDVACDYNNYTVFTRWARVKYAMTKLMSGLHNNISEEEFKNTLRELSNIYDTGMFGEIIRFLIRLFFGVTGI